MTFHSNRFRDLLNHSLRPRVKKIDEQGMYPSDFLKLLGQEGLYSIDPAENLQLIREVAAVCASTAFVIWCQVSAIRFVQNSGSEYLKRELLSSLLSGEMMGGTGISNAMKFYAGMEDLKLEGEKTSTGYRIKGALSFVSNLDPNGWFGIVFRIGETQRVMALVPCHLEGLSMRSVDGFLGLNGTATYNCQFQNADIPQEYILTEDADELIAKIRSGFLLTQVGLSLGITHASLYSMFTLQEKQNSTNRFLPQQPEELEKRLRLLSDRVQNLFDNPTVSKEYYKEAVRARLDSAYLAMDAAQSEMLHAGAAGYVAGSPTSRRWRESMFLAVVTPAIKHLEKILYTT